MQASRLSSCCWLKWLIALTPMRSVFSTSSIVTGTILPSTGWAKNRFSGPAMVWNSRV